MDLASINWLAVFLAALSTFLIGGLWYSPVMFGKAWLGAIGLPEEHIRGGKPVLVFGGAFVLAFVIATNLAMFLGRDAGVAWGATAGALAGVGWVSASLGVIYLFERRPFRLFAVNAGYQIVTAILKHAKKD